MMEGCIRFLMIHFPGHAIENYRIASNIGDPSFFNCYKRSIINVPWPPYIERVGPTYHEIFIDRVSKYLMQQEIQNEKG
jgi:hypothetical protein